MMNSSPPTVDLLDMSRMEALLGGVSDKVRKRLGGFNGCARDSKVLIYLLKPSDDKLAKFKGHHAGGLSRDEMLIPLFMASSQ